MRFLIVMSALAVSFCSVLAVPVTAKQPNIIYILLDDAGYGDLNCYGQTKFSTPNIDRLAAEGLRFTDHYSGSTVCAPTRCSLMTGVHTGHCYVRGNREVKPEGQAPIPGDTVTLAKLLQKAGYVTGGFGKWGLGAPGSEGAPERQGFDHFYGYNCQRQAHNYYPTHLWNNTHKVPLDGKTYAHDLIMDESLKFVRANKRGPFFCFLPVTIPHAAMHVPEEYAAPFREKFPEFKDKIGRYAGPSIKNPIAAFAGMMVKIDQDVGRLMTLLAELQIEENTLVLLSSDNGPHREGGHDPTFFNSNAGLRGFKRDLYEGGIRAPLIARWPGKITAGTESDHISAQWDMLPTFCEFAGTDTPDGGDGVSLVSTLLGKSDQQKKHKYLYWEFFEQGGKRAVRFGNWKTVQQNLHKTSDGPIELFDLQRDRSETNDVAQKHPDVIAKAKQYFAAAHTPSENWVFKTLDSADN